METKERISKHVTYAEATYSTSAKKLGINNIPTEEQLANIKDVTVNIFEPTRDHFGCPIFISSLFRSVELNTALKGAKNSQHVALNGAAIDIDADMYGYTTNKEIFEYILNNLDYDQLIAEGVDSGKIEWVHVSYNKGRNRKQALLMAKVNGKVTYPPYTAELLEQYLNKK